jgi:hypothetical protein
VFALTHISQPPPSPQSTDPSPFDRFRRLAQGIVNVPKAEADNKEAEWQKKRAAKKKGKGK